MDKQFIEEMRETLETQRQELMGILLSTNAAFRQMVEESSKTGDTIDEAADVIDRTMLETLNAKDAGRLQLIDSALTRIRQGKYGVCLKCGKEIPIARIRAIPHAVLCVDCKSAEERRNR
ncbi:MAG: TraR/DksA family transcriptional regulator [Spirochaetaceae bacterium]|jgi:RNA polymerase-binding protein DksA|nr:TraR/DksA family transcriptional regulator [Spirochaetaceae bacterium]